MKKLKNIIKIFLALAIVFSQLSNATLVFAAEVNNNDTPASENEASFSEEETPSEDDTTEGEESEEDEDKETIGEETPSEDDTTEEESEEETVGEDTPGSEDPLGDDENSDEISEEPEEKTEFTLEDLETLMNVYINGEEVPEELVNLLIAKGAPSVENGQFTALTLEDIMFVSELLKENTDTDTERE